MPDTPLEAVFRLQRETIRQTGAVAEELVRLPAAVGGLLTEGAETQRELHEQALELTRQSVHRSLDGVESVTGDSRIDSLRSSVDTTFDTLETQQDEVFEMIDSESDSVSEALLEQVNEQIDLVVELNEQIEQQVTEMLEDGAVPEEFLSEVETQLTAVTEQLDTLGGDHLSTGTDLVEIELESGDSEPDEDTEED